MKPVWHITARYNRIAERPTDACHYDTPLGKISLIRRPATGRLSPEDIANGRELWTLEHDGVTRMEIFDAAPRGPLLRGRITRGLSGALDECPMTLTSRSSLLPRRREFTISSRDDAFTFRGDGFRVQLSTGHGSELAGGSTYDWEVPDPGDIKTLLILAAFDALEGIHFLRSPLWRSL